VASGLGVDFVEFSVKARPKNYDEAISLFEAVDEHAAWFGPRDGAQ
jgi:hypothetical protein